MWRTLKVATALALFLAGSVVAETAIDLPIPEARALATQAALSGDPETARRIAAGLLRIDPNDRAALLVLAAVEPQLGRPTQGRLAGARAFAVSVTDAEKYEAARLTALAAANEGRFTLAGWWLRRALTVAPTPADAAQTVADARGLRNLNPWSSSVELSFNPSDNVNGGAETAFNVIDGVPFVGVLSADAQALSGWSGTLNLTARYRIAASSVAQTTVSARAYGRGVLLSEQAQDFLAAAGSDATARNFSSALLEFGLRHDRALTNGAYGLGLTLGQAWSAAEFDYTFLRVSADRRLPVSDADSLSFSVSVEQRWDDDDDVSDWRKSVQAGWTHALPNGDQVSATVGYSATESPTANNASTTQSAQVGYVLARPLGPAQVQFSAGVQVQEFNAYRIGFIAVPGGRQDTRVFGTVDLFFPDYDYAGFAPVVTLNAGRTDSNVSRFAHDDLSISFAFRSTF